MHSIEIVTKLRGVAGQGDGAPLVEWQAVAGVMQVGELWAALDHFNGGSSLGGTGSGRRGRRADAINGLRQVCAAVQLLLLRCTACGH